MKIFEEKGLGRLRVIEVESTVYFVGNDVARILGYKRPDNAIKKHVDADDKIITQIQDDTQRRTYTVITESGLYSLVLASKLESAKRFKKWVTADVLPAIRSKGMYATDELLDNPDLLIQVATELKREREEKQRLKRVVKNKTQLLEEVTPKAIYLDAILKNTNLITITQIAKDYGYTAKAFNLLLKDLRIQFKKGNQWFLFKKYADKGYTQSYTTHIRLNNGAIKVVTNTKWTQSGRLFLYNYLKTLQIVPILEAKKHII